MFSYIRGISLLIFLISSNAYANENIKEKNQILERLTSILALDKKRSDYEEVLNEVEIYPQFTNKSNLRDYNISLCNYVKSLMPYFLKKIKNDELNGEFSTFHALFENTKDIENYIDLSSIEKVSFDLVKENIKTENILRACSHAMNKYSDKKNKLDTLLDQLDSNQNSSGYDQLVEIKNDYGKLRRSVSSSFASEKD